MIASPLSEDAQLAPSLLVALSQIPAGLATKLVTFAPSIPSSCALAGYAPGEVMAFALHVSCSIAIPASLAFWFLHVSV